jgi:hypothetical protein
MGPGPHRESAPQPLYPPTLRDEIAAGSLSSSPSGTRPAGALLKTRRREPSCHHASRFPWKPHSLFCEPLAARLRERLPVGCARALLLAFVSPSAVGCASPFAVAAPSQALGGLLCARCARRLACRFARGPRCSLGEPVGFDGRRRSSLSPALATSPCELLVVSFGEPVGFHGNLGARLRELLAARWRVRAKASALGLASMNIGSRLSRAHSLAFASP